MKSAKSKGSSAERELVHLFWNNGWAAIRAAGSGSIKWPVPDIVAARAGRKLAIECKTTENFVFIDEKEVRDIERFVAIFGAEAWFGIRFKKEWYFLPPSELKHTSNGYTVSIELAKLKGVFFEQLIGG